MQNRTQNAIDSVKKSIGVNINDWYEFCKENFILLAINTIILFIHNITTIIYINVRKIKLKCKLNNQHIRTYMVKDVLYNTFTIRRIFEDFMRVVE